MFTVVQSALFGIVSGFVIISQLSTEKERFTSLDIFYHSFNELADSRSTRLPYLGHLLYQFCTNLYQFGLIVVLYDKP